MKTLYLLFILSTFLFQTVAWSGEKITCYAARSDQSFVIDTNTIVVFKGENNLGRNIASSIPVRTVPSVNGYTKVLQYEGSKYSIHIEDTNNFSEVDDYVAINARSGHEITYPITCNKN